MKKFSTITNYLYLITWMLLVLVLLGLSWIKEFIVTLLKKGKNVQRTNAIQRQKRTTRYIITNIVPA